jgi:WD40 repeat protein
MLSNWRLVWSPDGAWIAGVRLPWAGGDGVMVWDAETGELAYADDECESEGVVFMPDGRHLLIACVNQLRKVAVDGWHDVLAVALDPSVEGFHRLDLAGHVPDGVVLGVGQNRSHANSAAVHWFDAETLEPIHSIENAHDGSPKSYALDPDGTLLATGSSDGYVKVWDVAERRLAHEFPVGDTEVQGVAFVGEHHLAVATNRDGIDVYTLDPEELAELTRASLSRGFTQTECDRYGLEEECATLVASSR